MPYDDILKALPNKAKWGSLVIKMQPDRQEEPHEIIESLRSDREIITEILKIYEPCSENIIPQLWHFNEALKKRMRGLKKSSIDTSDINEVMTELLSDLIKRVFQLPIYIFACSEGGYVIAIRFEWDVEKEATRTKVFADHKEGKGWTNPVHFFFVDGKGEVDSVRVDSENPSS